MKNLPFVDQIFSNPKIVGLIVLVIVLSIIAKLVESKRRRPRRDDSARRRVSTRSPSPVADYVDDDDDMPPAIFDYRPQTYVLSEAERRFLIALQQAITPHLLILSQVPLLRLIAVQPKRRGMRTDFNRIAAKHVDFVICDQWTRPIVVIELDDVSHATDKRKERDEFVDAALTSAGVRIERVTCANSYDVDRIRELIGQAVP